MTPEDEAILKGIFSEPTCPCGSHPETPFCMKCGRANNYFIKEVFEYSSEMTIEEALEDCRDQHRALSLKMAGQLQTGLYQKYPFCEYCGGRIV